MIRPQPARWFEILAARDDAFVALEALATSGAVEIEWHVPDQAAGAAAKVNQLLKDYGQLARRYRSDWPTPRLSAATAAIAPEAAFEAALATLTAWAVEADPLLAERERHEAECAGLKAIEKVVQNLRGTAIDCAALANAETSVRSRVFVYPAAAQVSIPPAALVRRFAGDDEAYAIVVGSQEALAALANEVASIHGRSVALPKWLVPDADENLSIIAARIETAQREARRLREALAALNVRHGIDIALGNVVRATWCFQNAGAIAGGDLFSRITGWTSDPARLVDAIAESNARALPSFPPAPRGVRAPLLLRNPRWVRPFELFSRLFGMPSEQGADPSVVLAVVSPLMFGYMFGDVAQGAILVAAGLALKRRFPTLRLLIPGGIASIAFGLLFGSVLGVEGVIHPLWTNPLEHPLPILLVPIAGGALLLLLGLALNALAAYWRGAFVEWLQAEAGFVLVYGGLLLLPFNTIGAAVALFGAAAYIAGNASLAHRPAAALAALGSLAEHTLQILVNTLSFARVGAFALGHAGLCAAVVLVAEATGGAFGYAVVLLIGNALVIALEGLVVAIQTTRLILFEFFARFFEAKGREFRPLAPPAFSTEER